MLYIISKIVHKNVFRFSRKFPKTVKIIAYLRNDAYLRPVYHSYSQLKFFRRQRRGYFVYKKISAIENLKKIFMNSVSWHPPGSVARGAPCFLHFWTAWNLSYSCNAIISEFITFNLTIWKIAFISLCYKYQVLFYEYFTAGFFYSMPRK